MTAKKFVSKADTWLLLVLLASMLLLVVGVGVSLYSETSALRAAGVLIVTLLVLLLIGSVVFRTYYLIDGNHLKIVSGPFRWMVSIDEITQI